MEFLNTFNPDRQKEFCTKANITKCYFGSAPTLAELNRVYGSKAAVSWLAPQLYNLSEYCGCKEKITPQQMDELAHIIADKYYYLKATELMLFFYRFKQGEYGRFYGAVDPITIVASIKDFIVERNAEYRKREDRERQQQYEEWRKRAITREEYEQLINKQTVMQ